MIRTDAWSFRKAATLASVQLPVIKHISAAARDHRHGNTLNVAAVNDPRLARARAVKLSLTYKLAREAVAFEAESGKPS
jgi:hypothetical protein